MSAISMRDASPRRHRHRKHCLLGAFAFLVSAWSLEGAAQTNEPIPARAGWLTAQRMEYRDSFKVFRKYGYLGGENIPNLMMYLCARDPRRAHSHDRPAARL